MRELDLQADDPEDYQERLVRVYGAEYVIGRYLGEGGERFVHELVNRRSRIVTHTISILRDQHNAAEISATLLKNLNTLRRLGCPVVPDHMIVYGHGGVFEIREGAEQSDLDEQMMSALLADRIDEAGAIGRRILDANPYNTHALSYLGFIEGEHGDALAGLELMLSAVKIEPNTRAYKVNLLRCARVVGAFWTFWWQFEELRKKWPFDHSADSLAVEAYLAVGQPEKAAELQLDDDMAQTVRREVEFKKRADAIMGSPFILDGTLATNAQTRDTLARAYALYPQAPQIAVNYGLALLLCEQGREAHDVLAAIVPVIAQPVRTEFLGCMAFGLAIDGDWDGAVRLLGMVVHFLGPKIQPVDLPGWPIWWQEETGMLIYSRHKSPSRLVAQSILNAGPEKIGPEVHSLLKLYDRFDTLMAQGGQSGNSTREGIAELDQPFDDTKT